MISLIFFQTITIVNTLQGSTRTKRLFSLASKGHTGDFNSGRGTTYGTTQAADIRGGQQNQILNIHIFIHSMPVSHQVSSVFVLILLKDGSRLSVAGSLGPAWALAVSSEL